MKGLELEQRGIAALHVADILRKWGLLIGLILLMIIFSISANRFFTVSNIANIIGRLVLSGSWHLV